MMPVSTTTIRLSLLLSFLWIGCLSTHGQAVDSVAEETVNTYYGLAARLIRKAAWEEALAYTDSIYALSTGIQYHWGTALALLLQGEIHQKKGDLSTAYQRYRQNIDFLDTVEHQGQLLGRIYQGLYTCFSLQDNRDSMAFYANQLLQLPCNKYYLIEKNNIIKQFFGPRQFREALFWSRENLACSRSLERHSITISTLSQIGHLYEKIGDYDTYIAYIDSTLQIAEQVEDSLFIFAAYDNLGTANTRLENHTKALYWFKKSVHIAEIISHYGQQTIYKSKTGLVSRIPLATVYQHLAAAYHNLNDSIYADSAYTYYQKALHLSYQSNNTWNTALQLTNIANLMIKSKGEYQGAIDSLKKAYTLLPQHYRSNVVRFGIYRNMGIAYDQLQQPDQAKRYLDSAEVMALQLQDSTKLIRIYQDWNQFYTAQNNYEKAYQYLVLETSIEKAIQTQTAKKNMLNLEIKHETEQVKQKNLTLTKDNELKTQVLVFNQQINTRNWWIIIGLVLFLILGAVIAYLSHQSNKLYAQFKIMQLEQKALKAQINPHFFFNVLSSLQGLILSEDPMTTYRYHGKFTKLMRLILNQSDEEGISLQEELKALQLYLELEQLRTGHAFEFDIQNTVGESSQTTMVPSMLLQPFVENSIWHGVMNRGKDEKKHIHVQVTPQAQQILCEITDTGVGRDRAAAIKQQKTNLHKSMGMEVTKNRLDLFKLRYNLPLTFFMEDVKDAAGEILGTKVVLEIPKLVP